MQINEISAQSVTKAELVTSLAEGLRAQSTEAAALLPTLQRVWPGDNGQLFVKKADGLLGELQSVTDRMRAHAEALSERIKTEYGRQV